MKDQQEEKNKRVALKSSSSSSASEDKQAGSEESKRNVSQEEQGKGLQEKPKKKRGRKPKSETPKNLEKKEVAVKTLPENEKKSVSRPSGSLLNSSLRVSTADKVNEQVKKEQKPVVDSKQKDQKINKIEKKPEPKKQDNVSSFAHNDLRRSRQDDRRQDDRRQDDRRQDYRSNGNSGGRQNGGKNYRAVDRQQQEAKYMSFVKTIQDMPKEELKSLTLAELNSIARRLGMVGGSLMSKDKLFNKILEVRDHPEREEVVSGVLEKLPDGFGFLRSPRFDYISGPDDIYISPSQIRRFGLKTGDTVSGIIRKPKDGEKYFALLKVDKVNYKDPIHAGDRLNFDRLSPLHPDKKMILEHDSSIYSTRLIDIFSPIGKGQRGLLVAPPKVGKTVLLKDIALSLQANHPDVYLIVLLIDERPEEVTDMRRTIEGKNAEVISSTFDESANRHVQVAEIVLEKAKRMVEGGLDVVILLDSITRLARAYNTIAPASGKVLTGGIDANALQRPKKFFGAARYLEGAGSLTIIATALVDTGSKMDEVIYEEFKGTGNMEMHMTRKLSSRRIYPAFDLLSSGTRRDDLLQPEGLLNKVWILQRFLGTLNVIEGMEFLTNKMRKFKTNKEFIDSINK